MSWDQLEAILAENRAVKRQEASRPPTVCPIDGEILDIGKHGVRNCPFGNFTWTG